MNGAKVAVEALKQLYGTKYKIGSIADTICNLFFLFVYSKH